MCSLYMKVFALVGLAVIALCGCGGNRATSRPYLGANAQETLQIRVPAQAAQSLMKELQRKSYFTGTVTMRVEPLSLPQETTQIAASAYVRAFEDARNKAAALAAHMQMRLSSARDITEVSGSGWTSGDAGLRPSVKGIAPQGIRVNAIPNRPVALAVTFGLESAPARAIAVFGTSETPPSIKSMQKVQGLSIDLAARDSDLPTAAGHLRDADSLVRNIARSVGARDGSFSVTDSNFGSY